MKTAKTFILSEGFGRNIPLRLPGGAEIKYAEYRNRNLEKEIREKISEIATEGNQEAVILSKIMWLLDTNIGKLALRNFGKTLRRLYKVEVGDRASVGYILPVKLAESTPIKSIEGKRFCIAVRLLIGYYTVSDDGRKNYKNYVVPAVIMFDVKNKAITFDRVNAEDLKEVTVLTNTPGAFEMATVGTANILQDAIIPKKPTAEKLIKMFTTGVVSGAVENYIKPGEKTLTPNWIVKGFPVNGYYLYADTRGYEFTTVKLGIIPERDGTVSVKASLSIVSTEGVDKKTMTLITKVKPAKIKYVIADTVKLTDEPANGQVAPVVYVIDAGRLTGVAYTLDKLTVFGTATLIASGYEAFLTNIDGTKEVPGIQMDAGISDSYIEFITSEFARVSGVKFTDRKFVLTEENSTVKPGMIAKIYSNIVLLPVEYVYSKKDGGYTRVKYYIVGVKDVRSAIVVPADIRRKPKKMS